MASVLIVADDLTGANACAAGFARAGLRSVTVGLAPDTGSDAQHPAGWSDDLLSSFDVVVATTDSRHAPADDASRAVRRAVTDGWPAELVSCRIDTTLRGNVGVAAAAVLDTVRTLSGHRVVGLCLPAYPQAGRVTIEGNQLLNGQRLEDTELARDIRSPMRTSRVAEILSAGTSLRCALITLSDVTSPQPELVQAIRTALIDDPDVIICDALTVDHLDRLATAAVRAAPDLTWCGIDPGPGSVAIARAMGLHGSATDSTILVVSGSATTLTQRQLARLLESRDVVVVRPATSGSPLPEVDATAAEVIEAISGAGPGQVVALVSVLDSTDVLQLSSAEADELPLRMGAITRRVLDRCSIAGLYTTGGDITAAVLAEIGGRGIEVTDEVIPLAVAGEIVGGQQAELPIVTKGGMIGDAETAVTCIAHLERAIEQRRRWVRSADTTVT